MAWKQALVCLPCIVSRVVASNNNGNNSCIHIHACYFIFICAISCLKFGGFHGSKLRVYFGVDTNTNCRLDFFAFTPHTHTHFISQPESSLCLLARIPIAQFNMIRMFKSHRSQSLTLSLYTTLSLFHNNIKLRFKRILCCCSSFRRCSIRSFFSLFHSLHSQLNFSRSSCYFVALFSIHVS